MLVYKSKNKLWDLNWEQHGDWYYASVNDSYKLISSAIYEVETKADKIVIDDTLELLVKALVPSDLQKKRVNGIPVLLADGNEWYVRTIANVNYKLTLKNGEEYYEACDPLFTLLISYADEMKAGVDINKLVDLIVACLETNYYLNRKIVAGLGLLTTDMIEEIVKKIYLWGDKIDEFFR